MRGVCAVLFLAAGAVATPWEECVGELGNSVDAESGITDSALCGKKIVAAFSENIRVAAERVDSECEDAKAEATKLAHLRSEVQEEQKMKRQEHLMAQEQLAQEHADSIALISEKEKIAAGHEAERADLERELAASVAKEEGAKLRLAGAKGEQVKAQNELAASKKDLAAVKNEECMAVVEAKAQLLSLEELVKDAQAEQQTGLDQTFEISKELKVQLDEMHTMNEDCHRRRIFEDLKREDKLTHEMNKLTTCFDICDESEASHCGTWEQREHRWETLMQETLAPLNELAAEGGRSSLAQIGGMTIQASGQTDRENDNDRCPALDVVSAEDVVRAVMDKNFKQFEEVGAVADKRCNAVKGAFVEQRTEFAKCQERGNKLAKELADVAKEHDIIMEDLHAAHEKKMTNLNNLLKDNEQKVLEFVQHIDAAQNANELHAADIAMVEERAEKTKGEAEQLEAEIEDLSTEIAQKKAEEQGHAKKWKEDWEKAHPGATLPNMDMHWDKCKEKNVDLAAELGSINKALTEQKAVLKFATASLDETSNANIQLDGIAQDERVVDHNMIEDGEALDTEIDAFYQHVDDLNLAFKEMKGFCKTKNENKAELVAGVHPAAAALMSNCDEQWADTLDLGEGGDEILFGGEVPFTVEEETTETDLWGDLDLWSSSSLAQAGTLRKNPAQAGKVEKTRNTRSALLQVDPAKAVGGDCEPESLDPGFQCEEGMETYCGHVDKDEAMMEEGCCQCRKAGFCNDKLNHVW